MKGDIFVKIVAFEGINQCGKSTQAELLKEALTQRGLRVAQMAFHNTSSPIGQFLVQWLNGSHEMDRYTVELLMAADKQQKQQQFAALDQDGTDVLLIERYTLSQDAFSRAHKLDTYWINSLQKFMRQPDVDILIDISVEESLKRRPNQAYKVFDLLEGDEQTLKLAREAFLHEARRIRSAMWLEGFVYVINGQQPKETIHQEIVQFIEKEVLKEENQ